MNRKEKFEDLQLDFYRWMVDFGGIKPGTSQTYISKMKFLSDFYNLDFTISEEYIDRLLLGLQEGVVLKRIDERHKTYLEYHNDRCFFE